MSASSARPRIVVTNPIHAEVRERLEAVGSVDMNAGPEPWSRTEIAARLHQADAMMAFMTDRIDAAMLEGAGHIRVVGCALKGFDSFDVDACTRAGAWLTIVPDLLTEPTAELALGLAISLARHIPRGDESVRSGRFQGWRPQLYGTGLHGSTAAVIGLGMVGQAIVTRLAGFQCARLVGVDPVTRMTGVENAALEAALKVADFVFVAAPLTAQSCHLLDGAALAHCQPAQFIINVGRGSVVDEEAVADALQTGRLAGYAADVFECEDWGLDSRPAGIASRLLERRDTLFTPHLGSAVRKVRIAIEHRAADNIIAVLEGREPADAVNRPESVTA